MGDNEYKIVYQSKELPLFQFDATLIEQILHNIIHNAIRYTPIGSTIKIDAFATNEACIIQVSDNGRGFPDGNMDQVFEKFYRLPKSVAGGTGLVLSTAQGFAQAHNGNIKLRNKIEGGAEFTITIPAKMTDPKHYQNE
jgi:two-component system sensor histidine kinase KdpD